MGGPLTKVQLLTLCVPLGRSSSYQRAGMSHTFVVLQRSIPIERQKMIIISVLQIFLGNISAATRFLIKLITGSCVQFNARSIKETESRLQPE